jgi:hypothetical protein
MRYHNNIVGTRSLPKDADDQDINFKNSVYLSIVRNSV